MRAQSLQHGCFHGSRGCLRPGPPLGWALAGAWGMPRGRVLVDLCGGPSRVGSCAMGSPVGLRGALIRCCGLGLQPFPPPMRVGYATDRPRPDQRFAHMGGLVAAPHRTHHQKTHAQAPTRFMSRPPAVLVRTRSGSALAPPSGSSTATSPPPLAWSMFTSAAATRRRRDCGYTISD